MDRFKFRVFSTTNKRYTDIGLSTALAANSVSNNQFVIQQCLGVKDKTGRLIYEGDIVRYVRSKAQDTLIQAAIGEIRVIDANFAIYQIREGTYNYYSNSKLEELKQKYSEEEYKDIVDNNLDYFEFYDQYGRECSWARLEVVASIADNYLIDLEGNVISTLTTTEDILKQLGV